MRPRTGYVAMEGWKVWREQFVVDRDSQPWRLDPLQTAQREGVTRLGLSWEDPFLLQGLFDDHISGRSHAFVKVLHADSLYLLELCQPVRQGKTGIWAIERINEMQTGDLLPDPRGIGEGYVYFADEDYLHEQRMIDAGNNPWRLDPLQVVRVTGITRLGFREGDRFFWRGAYKENGTGRQKAVVWAFHGNEVYQIELGQPALQGDQGVWAVEHVMRLSFTNPPYSCT